MIEILAVLGFPVAGALVLAAVGHRDQALTVNVVICLATFLSAVALTVRVISYGPLLVLDRLFFVDSFNVFLVALTAFVGFTTSIFSGPYMRIEREHGRLTPARLRLYHSMYQVFNCTMLLALLTNNMGILWVAMEAATLATVLLVSLYRTPASLEAAWKYFILCGVGIAQALFGTILLYFAAEKVLGAEGGALLWTELNAVKGQLEPTVLSLAFVFLLVGYGTKVGLVPLHNWLPDAHAEGPTPVSAVLSGLLLNVALYAVVRCKVLVDGSLHTSFAEGLMMGFGILSVVVAAFLLSRQRDIKRLFAYSSIEHMGIITFAFGMGGPIANFAGLLHMTVHSLTKSRPAAYDRAFADQIGNFFRGGSRRAEDRHPAHGRHPRAGHHQSCHRLGADAGGARDPRHAAVRRFRQRIPYPDHGDTRAAVGDAIAAAFTRRRVRRCIFQSAADGIRGNQCHAAAAPASDDSGVRASGHRAHAGPVDPALPRRLVSAGRETHRMMLR